MGKESETENPKKRRKSVSGNSAGVVKEEDIYKTIISYEEKEARERLPERDSECFLKTCDSIRKAMNKIGKLKSDHNAKDEIYELQIQTSLAFIELKKLNRMEKFRTKFARDSLITAKSTVDSRHLHLQNLLYEVMHLKKEVMKCLQFKSQDESIELVTEEEFYKEAPESITRAHLTKENQHQLRLARLEWELTQRKQLAMLCDELSEHKKSVGSSIESKQNRLDNLAPQLRQILEASKSLQESLGLPLDKTSEEHHKASLLVSPLYVLYSKATAYRDAYDGTLIVKVEGDEEEAKRINSQEGSMDSDSDQDLLENIVEENPSHKKRHHRVSKETRQEERKSKLLQRHPLTVQIVLKLKNETKLTLEFFYMLYLKVITVESKLETDNTNGISAGDMLVSESVLRELYPQDFGLESPNPANQYQLLRHNLGSFSTLNKGIPYRWAQRMAGLYFISSRTEGERIDSNELAQTNMESVLKEIKRRVKARLDLSGEIRQLESGNIMDFSNTTDPVPEKVVTYLCKFTTLSWKSYSNYPEIPELCKQGLVSSVDIFYEAVLRRGSNELIARIAIKPDYPKVPAVFNITMNPRPLNSTDDLRDIEREINVSWSNSPTLSLQLQRLHACFDIYLETQNLVSKEKIFFHPVKGRTRSRPYKYLSIGGGIFTQR